MKKNADICIRCMKLIPQNEHDRGSRLIICNNCDSEGNKRLIRESIDEQ